MPDVFVLAQEVHEQGVDGMLEHLRPLKASDEAGNCVSSSSCPVQRYYSARVPGVHVSVGPASVWVMDQESGREHTRDICETWEGALQQEFFKYCAWELTVGQVRKALRKVKKRMGKANAA